MKAHKEAKHEGIRYQCDQCEYRSVQLSGLTMHKQSKHEGVTYSCQQCAYVTSAKKS